MHVLLLREFGLDPASDPARRAVSLVRARVTWRGCGPEECDDNTTICVLEALLGHEWAGSGVPEVTAARLRGQAYLLERRLFRRRSTGEAIERDRKGGAGWTRFAFPTWWHYDRKRLKVKTAELLKALEDARAGVEAALTGLDETQLLAADACGAWSIKDVLAHLTACEAELVTGLARIRRGQSPGKVLYTDAEIQAQNEKWQSESRDRSLEQVLADFRGVRRQLVRQLESLDDQDLNAPRPWFQKRTIADWVQDEIVAHDREHARGLAEWRKRQGL